MDLQHNVTCVAISGRGLMLEGHPGCGKSTLALELIDRGAVLIGDDGIAIETRNQRTWAHPPPRIAGLLEIRGVGIVTLPTTSAPLCLVLALDKEPERLPEPFPVPVGGATLPRLAFAYRGGAAALRAEYAMAMHGLALPAEYA